MLKKNTIAVKVVFKTPTKIIFNYDSLIVSNKDKADSIPVLLLSVWNIVRCKESHVYQHWLTDPNPRLSTFIFTVFSYSHQREDAQLH